MVKEDIFGLFLKEYGKVAELQCRRREPCEKEYPEMECFDVYDKNLRAVFVVAPQP